MTSPLRSLPRKESLYEQTYQALREAVLSGGLAPEERLVETTLAEQLRVSRTPLREALRQLQREGLVVVGAKGGLCVPFYSEQDAAHLYDCRLALEHLSVMGACQQASSTQIEEMETLVRLAEDLTRVPSSEQDPHTLLDIDHRFHHLIAESSGNRWLTSLLDQVFDKMTLLRMQTTRYNPGVLEVKMEHRQICEALARRDPIQATQAMTEHLLASKYRVNREVNQIRMQGQFDSPSYA